MMFRTLEKGPAVRSPSADRLQVAGFRSTHQIVIGGNDVRDLRDH